MSLEEKKQLLLEVRKRKMMLHNSILQGERKGDESSLVNSPRSESPNPITPSPKKELPDKLNTTLNRLTKQNTDKNKEYRCELNVVMVRKNVPKPQSPTSKLHEKMRNGE